MLGFGMATFFSLLLAIALRGPFIRLLFVMLACFAVYVCVAAAIGSRQLNRTETRSRAAVMANASTQVAPGAPPAPEYVGQSEHLIDLEQGVQLEHAVKREPSVLFPDPPPTANRDDQIYFDDDIDLFEGLEEFGTGEFDEDFFKPIPGLTFQPLNLDSSVLGFDDDAETKTLFGPRPAEVEKQGVDKQGVDKQGVDKQGVEEFVAAVDAFETSPAEFTESLIENEDEDFWETDHAHNTELLAELGIEVPGQGAADQVQQETIEASVDESTEALLPESEEPRRSEPTFTSPPRQRQRPTKRNKARPIYIESQLDEDDEQVQAVND